MERKYLVAALAMIATFAGVSRGVQSLQRLSPRDQHSQATSGAQCPLPSIVSRVLARIKTNLHQTDPEEAQMLAEMNLPIAALQAKAAEDAAKQSEASAEVARVAAMREAERAHREVQRMREEMAHQKKMTTVVSIQVPDYAALNRRIQVQTAAMAQRFAEQSARMQVAAAKWQAASMQMDNSGKRRSPCGTRSAEMR